MSIDETLGFKKSIGYAQNSQWLKSKVSPFNHKHCMVYDGLSVSVWIWDDNSEANESDAVLKSEFKSDGRWIREGIFQKTLSATDQFAGLRITPGTMVSIPGESGGIFYSVESEDTPDGSSSFSTAVSGVIMKKFPTGDNSVSGLIDNITNVPYLLSPSAQSNGKIKGVVAVVDVGTLDLAVNINGTPISGGESISVDPTVQTTTLETPVGFSLNDTISITPSNIVGAQRLSFIIQII